MRRTLFTALVLASCASDPGFNAGDLAAIRFIHVSPDAPALDVYVDGAMAIAGLPYPYSTTFALIDPGTHKIDFMLPGESESLVSFEAADLRAGAYYTAVAFEQLASLTLARHHHRSSAPSAANPGPSPIITPHSSGSGGVCCRTRSSTKRIVADDMLP